MVEMIVKPIIPKYANPDVIFKALVDELEKEARIDRQSFEPTIRTWTGAKPVFSTNFSQTNDSMSAHTGPTGNKKGVNKWIWLDKGTRENYPIVARRAPRLAYYKVGFKAKTSIKNFKSGAGARANRDFRRPYRVTHPGIKAREWSSELARIRTPQFVRRVNTRIRQASKQLF